MIRERVFLPALAVVLLILVLVSCDSTLRDQIELYVSIKNDGIIYVDGTSGNDANPGTRERPKASIQNAIDLAAALMDEGQVWVAEDTYYLTETLTVKPGISIYGGYSPPDWERNIKLYETVLQGVNVIRVIEVEPGADNRTVIDGFTIVTGSGIATDEDDLVVGICCVNTSLLISNNIIDATAVPEDGIGISNQRSSPTILNNYIYFGSDFDYSWGVLNTRSSPNIWNNVIIAGEGSSGVSTGIANNLSSAPSIQSNTIHGGESDESIGIYNLSSGCIIENNIILAEGSARSWGIYEESLGMQDKLRHNNFWDCDYVYVYDSGSGYYYYAQSDLSSLESDLTLQGCAVKKNIALDPVFDSLGDGWHLSDLSPIEVVGGGDSLDGVPDRDRDGTPRTVPWSIGAYEKN